VSGGLPAEVTAFLDEHIFSVTQLEVLLLACEATPAGYSAHELSRLARVPERSLTPWLDAFVERELLTRSGDGRYGPAELEPERAATLAAVADCFARRRVTLSRHVYASGEDPALRFADAFRFRKDKDKDR
jgi:hypothetical protein